MIFIYIRICTLYGEVSASSFIWENREWNRKKWLNTILFNSISFTNLSTYLHPRVKEVAGTIVCMLTLSYMKTESDQTTSINLEKQLSMIAELLVLHRKPCICLINISYAYKDGWNVTCIWLKRVLKMF